MAARLLSQTFEGVGLTKQRAKMAAAERALRRGFVQFLDVEPVNRVLRRSRDRPRDVMDDVIVDFTEDESPPPTSFADVAALSPAASASSSAIYVVGRLSWSWSRGASRPLQGGLVLASGLAKTIFLTA